MRNRHKGKHCSCIWAYILCDYTREILHKTCIKHAKLWVFLNVESTISNYKFAKPHIIKLITSDLIQIDCHILGLWYFMAQSFEINCHPMGIVILVYKNLCTCKNQKPLKVKFCFASTKMSTINMKYISNMHITYIE